MVDELAERLASGLAAPDAPPALYDVARKYIAHALEVHGNLFGDDRSRLLAAQSAVDAAFAKTVAQVPSAPARSSPMQRRWRRRRLASRPRTRRWASTTPNSGRAD